MIHASIHSDTHSWISTLSSWSATSSSLLIKVSQAWFIRGTIRFIFKALKEGDSVLRMCRHFSPLTILTKLFSGGGNSTIIWKEKKKFNVVLKGMKQNSPVLRVLSIWTKITVLFGLVNNSRGQWKKSIFNFDRFQEHTWLMLHLQGTKTMTNRNILIGLKGHSFVNIYGKPLLTKAIRVLNLGTTGF